MGLLKAGAGALGGVLADHTIIDHFPLCLRQFRYIAGQTHSSKEGICNGIGNSLYTIRLSDNSPDLALTWQDCPVKICCNYRDLLTFMCIGK